MGYQGQEKDPETNFTNFELRQLDPRLGRFFNPDPMGQYFSPYIAMANNPVSMIDPTGGEVSGTETPIEDQDRAKFLQGLVNCIASYMEARFDATNVGEKVDWGFGGNPLQANSDGWLVPPAPTIMGLTEYDATKYKFRYLERGYMSEHGPLGGYQYQVYYDNEPIGNIYVDAKDLQVGNDKDAYNRNITAYVTSGWRPRDESVRVHMSMDDMGDKNPKLAALAGHTNYDKEIGADYFTAASALDAIYAAIGVIGPKTQSQPQSQTQNQNTNQSTVESIPTTELTPTHSITKSKTEMQKMLNDVKQNGVKESIKFVENNGTKYIVDGHHRYYSALRAGISTVPAKSVTLPYSGYKTFADFIMDGNQPGYWKYMKPK